MNKRIVITILLAVFCMMNGIAQEYLSGFYGGIPGQNAQKSRDDIVLTLPFFDDFTAPGNDPDMEKWYMGNVTINSNFPKMPVNYRAATLDVIDEFGKVYSRGSSNPFIADSLISMKIRLDSIDNQPLSAADSIYLSFYYQPGGYGDSPDRDDSLVLKFGFNGQWKQVWATPGESLEAFTDSLGENKFFKKVMIPIVDSCYFTDDFQILFYNYGTLPTTMYPNDRSNMDQWNIDFVYLDKNRNVSNDSYPFVGFTENSPTFLKRYSSMPYKHYIDNPINNIENVFHMYLTNLDEVDHDVRYSCEVVNNNTGWKYNFSDNPFTVNRYDEAGVLKDSIVMGTFIYPYNMDVDSTSFTIRHYLDVIDGSGDVIATDSLVSLQTFGNYFSYDDGTPENGYGLVPSDTYFAVQFKVNSLDTIKGVEMLFNRTYNDANYNFFDIVVWRDNNGKPGQEMYKLKNQRPIWDDDELYKFSYFKFDQNVKVNSTFYVGIRQQYSQSINIGFDVSKDNREYNFYDAGAGWRNSSFPGSIMIRPIMGRNPDLDKEEQTSDNGIELYPNPAKDILRIELANDIVFKEIVVYDLTGNVVKRYPYSNELNVNDLQNGIYMLRAIRKDGSHKTSKLLISK